MASTPVRMAWPAFMRTCQRNRWMTMGGYQRYTRDQNGKVPFCTGYTRIYPMHHHDR